MSGKKAKQERRAMRESGVFCLKTRAGRKQLNRLELMRKAEEHLKQVQLEAYRWENLTPEQQDAERDQAAKKAAESQRRFEQLIGMLGAVGVMDYPALAHQPSSARSPYQRRGR